jgi:hypothetical protein
MHLLFFAVSVRFANVPLLPYYLCCRCYLTVFVSALEAAAARELLRFSSNFQPVQRFSLFDIKTWNGFNKRKY